MVTCLASSDLLPTPCVLSEETALRAVQKDWALCWFWLTAGTVHQCAFAEAFGAHGGCLFLSCLSLQPLNPNPDSRWNTYFKDNEVLLQIDKDVRCVWHNDSGF